MANLRSLKPTTWAFQPGTLTAILLVSVLGLFTELMLIRWIGTEVRIFAYLQNTVLIVCFLGMSLGCFTSSKPASMRSALVPLAILTCLLAIPFTRNLIASITDRLSVLQDLVIWNAASSRGPLDTFLQVFTGLLLTFGLMVLLWEIFVPMGRLMGRLMDKHPRPVQAYSINIAGSLLGIWLFVAMSAWSTPPLVWIGCTLLLMTFFMGRGRELALNVGLATGILVAALFVNADSNSAETHWSPYQKLSLLNESSITWQSVEGEQGEVSRLIEVNNVGYQGILDLSEKGRASNPHFRNLSHQISQYDLPLRVQPQAKNVLIVGAGSGNDVAGALRGGAQHITAVEIDPVIIEMGRRYHPERPYQASNVEVVNDDARSFFATTRDKYDLIIFGLLDSHTTTAMTNARLDHYVYTRESLTRAKQLLTEDGLIVLSFEAAKPYIADRMAASLQEVFSSDPLCFRIPRTALGWGGVMFITGNSDRLRANLAADQELTTAITEWIEKSPVVLSRTARIATDDWPYIYLEKARIPNLYLFLAALMVGLLQYGKRRLDIQQISFRWSPSDWHFFFLGAAFLLLEVQNISKASVVLGNTWLVNAVIISGILTMILLANLISTCVRRISFAWTGGLLMVSSLALYFFDLSSLAFLPYGSKVLLVGTLTTVPMLFAGILFIDSFKRSKARDRALGANLLGSIIGGMLQSITFVVGIKALLLLVAVLYAAAIFTRILAERGPTNVEDASDAESSSSGRIATEPQLTSLEPSEEASESDSAEQTAELESTGVSS